jgi:hypothetical protein
MKRWSTAIGFFLALLLIPVSCRQLFTSSLGKSLARSSITISSSASTSDLLELASSDTGSTAEGAKAILDALSGKSEEELAALSAEEKEVILNLAITASVDMGTITEIANSVTSDSDTDAVVSQILSSFDTSVNLTAVETILEGDTSSVSAETLVYASATVVADVASETSTATVMDALATGDTSSLTEAQQAQIETVITVKDDLKTTRSDELSDLTIGDFNIGDLLEGTTE